MKGKIYTYLSLRSVKGKNISSLEDKTLYTFDIHRVAQIFDYPLENQQIQLLNGHDISIFEENKDKRYSKQHIYSDVIINYTVFQTVIQKTIKDVMLKLTEMRVGERWSLILNRFGRDV